MKRFVDTTIRTGTPADGYLNAVQARQWSPDMANVPIWLVQGLHRHARTAGGDAFKAYVGLGVFED